MPGSASSRKPEEPWFLSGDGVTNALARSVDWENHSLGPWDTWPASLKTTLAMVFHARQPMFVWWGPELIQFYNDAYLPSFGHGKHPSAMGQRGRDCWQEIWPIIGPQIDVVMRGGEAARHEDQLVPIQRNGKIEDVYWTYSYGPVYADDGSIGGTLVVCIETTARVVAERRLQMLRALSDRTSLACDLTSLMRHAAKAIALFGPDVPLAVLYAEDRASGRFSPAEYVGFPAQSHELRDASLAERLLAELTQDPSPRVMPFDRLTDPRHADFWRDSVGQVWVATLLAAQARPAVLLLLGSSPRLPFDSAYQQFFQQIIEHLEVVKRRIEASQARVVMERERDNLLMQAPVAVAILVGPDHEFTLANRIYCEMVGRNNIVGKTYLEVFPQLTDTEAVLLLDRIYADGKAFVTEELCVPLDLAGDGIEDRHFKVNLEALRDDGGSVYGMMALAVDITNQVVARQHLERASREREKLLDALESANRAKDEFLAMLGHELRNPLAPIVTALQLMKLRGAGTTAKEQGVIERQVGHLVRLVDDLLDVSRITRGLIELRMEVLVVAEVLAKAVEMVSDLLEKRHHRLTLDLPTQDLLCNGDPVRIAQVVANLLNNAARYTRPGGSIGLSARLEAGEVVLRIKDSGIGIPKEMLPRVFDLFVQGQRGADRSQGGLGIGLAVVKSLVALHGGTVTASSDGPDKGSEIVVRLPAAGPTPRRAETQDQVQAQPVGCRILVVDDNVDAAETLGELLAEFGHEVRLAHDPLAALALIPDFMPHVAILDIGLPGMDGYELAAQIRATPLGSPCRLIALTGYGQDRDRLLSSAAGFECHFTKPIDIEHLVATIGRDGRERPGEPPKDP